MGYVFISYKSEERHNADFFKKLFNKNGIDTWMAPENIPSGSTYPDEIDFAIKNSSCFVLLFSNNVKKSRWVCSETCLAVEYDKKIFPVIFDNAQIDGCFKPLLCSFQSRAIKELNENDEDIKLLLQDIKKHIDMSKNEKVTQPQNYSDDFIIEEDTLVKYNGNSSNVTIPYGVTTIGDYSFSGCSSPISIILPDSVKKIDNYAFHGCSRLLSIHIPNSVTSIGNGAFSFCLELESVTIPDCVTSISKETFAHCENLVSIEISNNVTHVGDYAFSYCGKLISIKIPEGLNNIGEGVFYNCTNLTSITIPDGVTIIDKYAFAWCKNLTKLVIPESLMGIGYNAFLACKKLPAELVDRIKKLEV